MHGEILAHGAAIDILCADGDGPCSHAVGLVDESVEVVVLHVAGPVVLGIDGTVVQREGSVLHLAGLAALHLGSVGQCALHPAVHIAVAELRVVQPVDDAGLAEAVVSHALGHQVGVVATVAAAQNVALCPLDARGRCLAKGDMGHVGGIRYDAGCIGHQLSVVRLVATEVERLILLRVDKLHVLCFRSPFQQARLHIASLADIYTHDAVAQGCCALVA